MPEPDKKLQQWTLFHSDLVGWSQVPAEGSGRCMSQPGSMLINILYIFFSLSRLCQLANRADLCQCAEVVYLRGNWSRVPVSRW